MGMEADMACLWSLGGWGSVHSETLLGDPPWGNLWLKAWDRSLDPLTMGMGGAGGTPWCMQGGGGTGQEGVPRESGVM